MYHIPPGPPLVVEVTETDWKAFESGPDHTPRGAILFAHLQELGGVAEGTPPGTYHFNIEMLDAVNVVMSLEPVE